MLSGASFWELCAFELKWPPLCRDSSLFEAGLHKETPAEWKSSCRTHTHSRRHTQMQCRNTPWKMQGKARLLRPRGSLSNVQSRSTVHTYKNPQAPARWPSPEVPVFPNAPNPHNHYSHRHVHKHTHTLLFVTFSGSCCLLTFACWWWVANDGRTLYCWIICLLFKTGDKIRDRPHYTVFTFWMCFLFFWSEVCKTTYMEFYIACNEYCNISCCKMTIFNLLLSLDFWLMELEFPPSLFCLLLMQSTHSFKTIQFCYCKKQSFLYAERFNPAKGYPAQSVSNSKFKINITSNINDKATNCVNILHKS